MTSRFLILGIVWSYVLVLRHVSIDSEALEFFAARCYEVFIVIRNFIVVICINLNYLSVSYLVFFFIGCLMIFERNLELRAGLF